MVTQVQATGHEDKPGLVPEDGDGSEGMWRPPDSRHLEPHFFIAWLLLSWFWLHT